MWEQKTASLLGKFLIYFPSLFKRRTVWSCMSPCTWGNCQPDTAGSERRWMSVVKWQTAMHRNEAQCWKWMDFHRWMMGCVSESREHVSVSAYLCVKFNQGVIMEADKFMIPAWTDGQRRSQSKCSLINSTRTILTAVAISKWNTHLPANFLLLSLW